MIILAVTSVNATNSSENTNANKRDWVEDLYVVLIHCRLEMTAMLPFCISSSDVAASGEIQPEKIVLGFSSANLIISS